MWMEALAWARTLPDAPWTRCGPGMGAASQERDRRRHSGPSACCRHHHAPSAALVKNCPGKSPVVADGQEFPARRPFPAAGMSRSRPSIRQGDDTCPAARAGPWPRRSSPIASSACSTRSIPDGQRPAHRPASPPGATAGSASGRSGICHRRNPAERLVLHVQALRAGNHPLRQAREKRPRRRGRLKPDHGSGIMSP